MQLDKDKTQQGKISLLVSIVPSYEEVITSLANRYKGQYDIAGEIFIDNQTSEYCLINVYRLTNSVRSLLISELELSEELEIEKCSTAVALTSYKLGYAACEKMARYVSIFLNLGGIAAVNVSTGILRNKDQWLANYDSEDVFDLYRLYAHSVQGDDYYYSNGMENFGKADVSMDLTEELGLANYVMNVFNYYRLTESAILKDGQTFQPDLECPMYRMQWGEWEDNPFGKWHLSRVSSDLDISYEVN